MQLFILMMSLAEQTDCSASKECLLEISASTLTMVNCMDMHSLHVLVYKKSVSKPSAKTPMKLQQAYIE
jgi:hypothetical protein